MCGIVGVIDLKDEGLEDDVLSRVSNMLKIQNHRGPDSTGSWISIDKSVILGHNRLAILDLSENGAQPMHSFDDSAIMVFNGEIYNFIELAKRYLPNALEVSGDTRVIIELYKLYGAEWLVNKINGMFSFIIYDKIKRVTYIARDAYGIKPLYVEKHNDSLIFSSEVQTIKKTTKQTLTVDEIAKVSYYCVGFIQEPRTIYNEIKAIRPGTLIKVTKDKLSEKCFYDLTSDKIASTPKDSKKCFSQYLKETVKAHIQSDAKLGVFLSAGFDSTTLLNTARHEIQGLAALTLGFRKYRNTQDDETEVAGTVAKHLCVDHHLVDLNDEALRAGFLEFLASMDQPSVDGFNVWLVSREAKRLGWKVALTGTGADELLYGYSSFSAIWKLKLLSQFVKFSKFLKISHFVKKTLSSIDARLEYLWYFDNQWNDLYLLKRMLLTPEELKLEIDDQYFKEFIQEYRAATNRYNKIRKYKEVISCLEIDVYLRNQLLRVTDWASMRHSIEVRVPFIDRKFIKQISPILKKIHMKSAKKLLLRSLDKDLINLIKKRPKSGFNTPINAVMQEHFDKKKNMSNTKFILDLVLKSYLES